MPTALLSLKIGLHTVIFQPLTTAGLMLIQALLRRDSWAEACGLVRRRCARAPRRPSHTRHGAAKITLGAFRRASSNACIATRELAAAMRQRTHATREE